MKLQLASTTSQNTFTGYGDGYVLVNAQRHERSLVVMPATIIENWGISDIGALQEEQVSFLTGLNVEIVLLGTGGTLRFPHPRLLQPLTLAGIGVEVMDTRAACRTYNVLVAEGRNIAAALIL